ncbi:GRB2-associated-binding protein 1-like isoform X2 [Artemia franciscana]|uniref:GRB2-associated-binding protein 1-like isoform X2 n=1 Tax=Artemia franciscana TaxID=6661 RepID=UPI0032DA443C
MLEDREIVNVVYQGWLIKSPPMKRLWRAKWRRRFFRLRDSGELPGQYVLEYFADKNCKKLKGQIDLDQLDQCDSGLSLKDSKHQYEFMFDLQTAKRVYYLAAETEEEMNKWVEYICQVCRLKMFPQDGEAESEYTTTRFVSIARHSLESSSVNQSMERNSPTDLSTPPTSPTSSSGPYVSLSECFTGRRPFPGIKDEVHISESSYDVPRSQYPVSDSDSMDSVQSPAFKTVGQWDSFSREGSITKLGFNNNAPTPPRPPKIHPKVIRNNSSECYMNVADCTIEDPRSPGVNFYDLPRTHQPELTLRRPSRRHFYTNASLVDENSRFSYDFVDTPLPIVEGTASPPSINRSLKPKTPVLTHSPVPFNSPSVSPGPLSSSLQSPPMVNRKLKPKTLNNSFEDSKHQRTRAALSPVPPLDTPLTLLKLQLLRTGFHYRFKTSTNPNCPFAINSFRYTTNAP